MAKRDGRLTVSLYASRVRIGGESRRPPIDSPPVVLSVDALGRETTTHSGGELARGSHVAPPSMRVRICNVLRSGVEVLNRGEPQPKLSSPAFVCNLLQIFRWLTSKYVETTSAPISDDEGNIYEDVNGGEETTDRTRPLEPLDFYAELFDDDLFALPDNNSCSSNRLAKHRRQTIVPCFWSRGGEILRLSSNTIVNFRRRVQRVEVFAWAGSAATCPLDVDMLLPLTLQRDTLDAILVSAARDDRYRGFSLTLKSDDGGRSSAAYAALRHDCDSLLERAQPAARTIKPSATGGDEAVRQIRVDFDTRPTLELGFLPWDAFPRVELSFDTRRSPTAWRPGAPPRLSLAESCWPSLETVDRAKSVLSLIAELIRLTDETTHRLRYNEFAAKLAHTGGATGSTGRTAKRPAFNAHLDKFAREHVDPTFQRLVNSRTLWGRLVEEMATNSWLPKSVALSVATIARDTVLLTVGGDRGDTARQYWGSVDLQNRLSTITLLGRAVAAAETATATEPRFLLFAVRSTSGSYTFVRGLPYTACGGCLRFLDRSEKLTVQPQAETTVATVTNHVRGEIVAHNGAASNSWESLGKPGPASSTPRMRKFFSGRYRRANGSSSSSSIRTTVRCLDLLEIEGGAGSPADACAHPDSRLVVHVQQNPANGQRYVVLLQNVRRTHDPTAANQIYSTTLERARQVLATTREMATNRPQTPDPDFLTLPRPNRCSGGGSGGGVRPTVVQHVDRISPRQHAKLWSALTDSKTETGAAAERRGNRNGDYLRHILRVMRSVLETTQRASRLDRRTGAAITVQLTAKNAQLESATNEFQALVDEFVPEPEEATAAAVQLRRPKRQQALGTAAPQPADGKRLLVEAARRMLHLVVELSEILLNGGHADAYRKVTAILREVAGGDQVSGAVRGAEGGHVSRTQRAENPRR